MNRIVLNIKMLPHCNWLKGFGRIKTKTQSREWRYEATWISLCLNVIKHRFMLSQKRVRSKCACEGWGTDLPAFRLRVVACMVGVKKRVGGGRKEVKKGEELGREGMGWRRSFFIFPFTLFSSPPSNFFRPSHRLSQAMRLLRRVQFPAPSLLGIWKIVRNVENDCKQLKSETSKKRKERRAKLPSFLLFISPRHFSRGYEVADPADLQTTLSIIWRLENVSKLLAPRANWNLRRAFLYF